MGTPHATADQLEISATGRRCDELSGLELCTERHRWRRTCERSPESSSERSTEHGLLQVEIASCRDRLQLHAERSRLKNELIGTGTS